MMYLLTVTLVWAAGLAIYLGLLKKVPAYGFNRAFLLTTLLGGLLVPFIPAWTGGPEALPALIRNAVVQLPSVVVTAAGTPAVVEASATPWWMILYACGVAVAIGLFVCSVYRLVQFFRNSKVVETLRPPNGLTVRETGRPTAPFSFAKTLFVAKWNALSEEEQQVLARHETAHYTHFHAVDNVLASITVVLAWFHPLVYVLRRELRLVHEFQADAHTLSEFDARSYREVLLRQQLGAPNLSLVASFAQSPLKTRFSMMTTNPVPRGSKGSAFGFRQNQFWRLGAALLCLLLVVAACTKEEITDDQLSELAAMNIGEEAAEFVEAAMSTDGMTLESVDTITMFNPETHVEEVTAIENWVGPNNSFISKNIRKPIGRFDADGNPIKLVSGISTRVRSQEVFKIAEQMPMFSGCENNGLSDEETQQCAMKKMLEFIYGNIKYPEAMRESGIEGTAVVTFVVGTDGELLDPRVVRNPGEVAGINSNAANQVKEELLRIIDLMPVWVPGKQNGKNVQVQFNLPVKFKLQ